MTLVRGCSDRCCCTAASRSKRVSTVMVVALGVVTSESVSKMATVTSQMTEHWAAISVSARVHHAARRGGSSVAGRGTGAAVAMG
jgi:hypothetical protein